MTSSKGQLHIPGFTNEAGFVRPVGVEGKKFLLPNQSYDDFNDSTLSLYKESQIILSFPEKTASTIQRSPSPTESVVFLSRYYMVLICCGDTKRYREEPTMCPSAHRSRQRRGKTTIDIPQLHRRVTTKYPVFTFTHQLEVSIILR